MGLIEAIILGIIQGLTEFLPVSSSGHLELGKALFGYSFDEESSLLFTVILHAATALSTVVVFRKTIVALARGLFAFKWNEETRYVLLLALSMVPVMAVGLLLKDAVESLFNGQLVLVGTMLLVTGLLLWFTQKASNPTGSVTPKRAFVIGLAQAIAILPGISRSGSTIATALLLGVDREQAARFSFLMVLPPIAGATLLALKDFSDADPTTQTAGNAALIAGFVAAFLSGLLACQWMIAIVKRSKLTWFAVYCFLVGSAAMIAGFMA